jgi:hypothetical protein
MDPPPQPQLVKVLYTKLPQSLKLICESVYIPNDGGETLISYLKTNNKSFIVAGNASLKDGNCAHAWLLTTNDINHLSDTQTFISGS